MKSVQNKNLITSGWGNSMRYKHIWSLVGPRVCRKTIYIRTLKNNFFTSVIMQIFRKSNLYYNNKQIMEWKSAFLKNNMQNEISMAVFRKRNISWSREKKLLGQQEQILCPVANRKAHYQKWFFCYYFTHSGNENNDNRQSMTFISRMKKIIK